MKFIQSLLVAIICSMGFKSFADKIENSKANSLNNKSIEKERSPTTNGKSCRSM